jgi:hypothetical protein
MAAASHAAIPKANAEAQKRRSAGPGFVASWLLAGWPWPGQWLASATPSLEFAPAGCRPEPQWTRLSIGVAEVGEVFRQHGERPSGGFAFKNYFAQQQWLFRTLLPFMPRLRGLI